MPKVCRATPLIDGMVRSRGVVVALRVFVERSGMYNDYQSAESPAMQSFP